MGGKVVSMASSIWTVSVCYLQLSRTYPSFSMRCRLHMLTAVCLTSTLSVLLLTTIPSTSGPATLSALEEGGREWGGEGGRGEREEEGRVKKSN